MVSATWKSDCTVDLTNTERRRVLDAGAALTDGSQRCLSLKPWQAHPRSRRGTARPFCPAAVICGKWRINMDLAGGVRVGGKEKQEIRQDKNWRWCGANWLKWSELDKTGSNRTERTKRDQTELKKRWNKIRELNWTVTHCTYTCVYYTYTCVYYTCTCVMCTQVMVRYKGGKNSSAL